MEVRELLFLDGELFEKKIPLRSLLYAEGVFETFRWKGSPPVYFEKHLSRMKSGAELLSIPFPTEKNIKNFVEESVKKSNIADAYVKICLLSSGPTTFYEKAEKEHLLTIIKKHNAQKERVRAHVASFRRNSSSPLLRIKSMNYLENVIARREAKTMGYDEPIFLNQRDEITEGGTTNLFWMKKNVLHTPSVNCGLLPGITREALISLAPNLDFEVREGRFNLEDVLSSDCAFLTNSLIGVVAVTAIDDHKINFDREIYIKIRDALFHKLGWIS